METYSSTIGTISTKSEKDVAIVSKTHDVSISTVILWIKLSTFLGVYLHNCMMTSSNGNIFCVTGPLCGEFTGPGEFPAQRPVTRSFDVFFDLRLNKRLSKQPWSWWFETPSWSLWRQRNGEVKKTHCGIRFYTKWLTFIYRIVYKKTLLKLLSYSICISYS